MLLDEPTSGLDSSISFEVLSTIRQLVKESEGKLSVILSIHQPNSRLLTLFDHLLILERGSMIIFGTNEESITYFSRIGYPCPSKVTPTDYFLKISDSNFNDSKICFKTSYKNSPEAHSLMSLLNDSITTSSRKIGTSNPNKVFFLKKIYYLIYRDFALAYRDPTLYYLQVILLLGFGFMYGAIFFMLPTTTNTFTQVQGGGIVYHVLLLLLLFKYYGLQCLILG